MPICVDQIADFLQHHPRFNGAATPELRRASGMVIREIMEEANARQMEFPTESMGEAIHKAAEEIATQKRIASMIERKNALLTIKKTGNQFNAIRGYDDWGDGFKARLVGMNNPRPGTRMSTAARGQYLRQKYFVGQMAEMDKLGLVKEFESGNLDRDIMVELAELNKTEGAQPGRSGITEARQIAEVLHKWQRVSVGRLNRAGAHIGHLEGFITSQMHDMDKVRQVGFEQWLGDILPELDADRTFRKVPPEGREMFLREAYRQITVGMHSTPEATPTPAFRTSPNLARKVSEHRVLHFKDADSFFRYNQKYGYDSLAIANMHQLERAAERTALLEDWGPNPKHTLGLVQERLRRAAVDDPAQMDRIAGRGGNLPHMINTYWKEVSGEARYMHRNMGATLAMTARAVNNMSMLGNVVLSSFNDVPAWASEANYQGAPFLRSVWDAFRVLLDTSGASKEVSSCLSVGYEGMQYVRYTGEDYIPGTLAKWQQRFFKLSGLTWWTNTLKRGAAKIYSHELALARNLTFDQLPPRRRAILEQYGIDARRWDIIRQFAVRDFNGEPHVVSDAIQEVPNEVLYPHTHGQKEIVQLLPGEMERIGREIQQFRDSLEESLGAYFVESVDRAVPTPNARIRGMIHQGLERGTWAGEAIRLMMQFKSFPITYATNVLGRSVRGMGKADTGGLVKLILAQTVFGYLSGVTKDFAKGRTPRDPTKLNTWLAALQQGGGLGIYGDFLLGETNRFGRSALETAAGPTFSAVADLDEIRARLMFGQDAKSQAFYFAKNRMPFINLFYTRAALDYLIFYQMQESMNPGYLRRMERRVEKENNQTFIIPPSRVNRAMRGAVQ